MIRMSPTLPRLVFEWHAQRESGAAGRRSGDAQAAAQVLAALAHPQYPMRVAFIQVAALDAAAVVDDDQDYPGPALAGQYGHLAGAGVARDIGQGLLEDAEQRRAALGSEADIRRQLERAADAGVEREFAGVPADRRHQSQRVEHR